MPFGSGSDIPDNGLPALMHMDVLDHHPLLSLASMLVERFHQEAEGPARLVDQVMPKDHPLFAEASGVLAGCFRARRAL
jgi:hypothetical protein